MNALKRMRPSLGTYVEIYAQTNDLDLIACIDNAYDEIYKINDLLSFHNVNSDLSKLNLSSGEYVELHTISIQVLRLAKAMTVASQHYFNCTVGGALVAQGALPTHGWTDYLLQGKAEDIEIHKNCARLNRKVLITLDGIAKGYAVDRAVKTLKKQGVTAGWVNAGGDIKVFGEMVMPIQRRELDGSYSLLGGLQQSAIATSTVRKDIDHTFPSMIVGKDKSPEIGAWSVLAKSAWRADALTKVMCNVQIEQRKQMAEKLGGVLV